jgi:hypothetical protein
MICKFAIITIHNGDIRNLLKTVNSVCKQIIKPDLHLIISKKFNTLVFRDKKFFFNKFITRRDKSLYNAMNIGQSYTKKYSILFLNSGDILYADNTLKLIKPLIANNNKCLNFKTLLQFGKKRFFIKNSIFYNNDFFSHPSFVRPPVKKIINFNEHFNIISDGFWMCRNADLYRIKKISNIISIHFLGGLSSNPKFLSIKDNFQFSFLFGVKEVLKFIILIIFKKINYYKFIYSKKFIIK